MSFNLLYIYMLEFSLCDIYYIVGSCCIGLYFTIANLMMFSGKK